MDNEKILYYGDELHDALTRRVMLAPLTEREPGITIEDAYRIQERMVSHRLDAGESIIGKKVGATSRAVQDLLKVNQPDFGFLLSGMVYGEGEAIPMQRLIQPFAEGEIAFLLKHDLIGPGITNVNVLRATECVMPCFEIVDSRITDWKIRIQDTVADNASCGVLVLGDHAVDPRKVDLGLTGMVIEKNGEIACTGAGAAALGHPANAVAWLANTLGRLGIPLKAGEVILSGSLGTLVKIAAGDNLRLSLGGIGRCSVRFV
ncbi:MAG TPA: 2-oxopent-4-enoate hydratase [Rhodocyclaceae bacterium]|nr:2-oxopent-4-enoate hydratase [Rhodocyclaceae bacterium]HNB78566.1 2-oxopent-4-enoate hydratase [Rhodocyclaceae bacterium]HNC62897.1 2-oxopent-4-enoate hydratase [Rhodocyclaceae bacterium]HNH14549.1 2-oxopent-4-enoate hydratase [Rhodocyclaceae bacterium]